MNNIFIPPPLASIYPPCHRNTLIPSPSHDCFITLVQLWLIPLPFRGETGILLLRRSLADPTSRIRIVVLSTMVENAASTVVTAWIKLRTSLLSPLTRPRIPRLTENETEFRRYTLFLFRTLWKNVKFYTERRKKEFNVFSVACLLFHCCENPRLKR